MKKMFKFLPVAAILAAGFTSCSNEVAVPDTQEPVSSERARLTVTISGDKTTRAITDNNATTEEVKATSATIFVFNASNAYQADTTVVIAPKYEDGNSKYKVSFNVPTGKDKRIYVGLNFTQAMIDAVKQKGLTDMTYSLAEQEGLFYKSSLKAPGTATFNGNPMFNAAPYIMDIEFGKPNDAAVTVERMTSKVTVVKEGKLTGSNVKTSNATFDLSTLEFALGNKNTKVLPMREQTNWIDPNWDGAITSYIADFANEFTVEGIDDHTKWDLTKYVKVDDDDKVAVGSRNTKYAFENTHKLPRAGEITYVSVKVKFTPDAIAKTFDDATKKPTLETNLSGINMDVLYVVVDNNSYYYYTDKAEASKHISYMQAATGSQNISFVTYRGQLCFFRVWLNSDPSSKELQTKRNEFYSVGLADIVKLGASYPEIDKNTIEDIEGESSSITVNITVNPWSLVNMGGVNLGE